MEWRVVQTDEFEAWFLALKAKEQTRILTSILQLKEFGPTLPFPLSSEIRGARHAMRELRVQIGGLPYRVLYAFDPVRQAVLLVGGNKGGDERWYRRNVPLAERLFEAHLATLTEEDHGKGS